MMFVFAQAAWSQQLISTSGNFGEGVTVDVSWTLGEPVTATGEMKSFDLVQGFLQNFPVFAIESLQLDFDAGWNIFSSWVKPVDGDLKLLFSPLIWDYSLIKVQDEAWNTLEDLGNLGGWKNLIGDLSFTEGYKVRMNRAGHLEVRGGRSALPLDIPLSQGWNTIGFPIDGPVDALMLVKPLVELGTLIKMQDERGYSVEDRGLFGGWVNHIGDCLPGEGYKINVSTPGVLTVFPSYGKTDPQVRIPE